MSGDVGAESCCYKPRRRNRCGDVDAVNVDLLTIHHHVAEVHADAELHAALGWQIRVLSLERGLNLDGALDRIHDTRELGEHAVAGGTDESHPIGDKVRRATDYQLAGAGNSSRPARGRMGTKSLNAGHDTFHYSRRRFRIVRPRCTRAAASRFLRTAYAFTPIDRHSISSTYQLSSSAPSCCRSDIGLIEILALEQQ